MSRTVMSAMLTACFLAIPLATYAEDCVSGELAHRIEIDIQQDPIKAVDRILGTPDCDAKYALLYKADTAIFSRVRDVDWVGFEKIFASMYREYNEYESYVLKHRDRFSPRGETDRAKVSRHRLERIKNPSHRAIAAREFEDLREADYWSWEDGDGRSSSGRLIESYQRYLRKFPSSPEREFIEQRVAELRERGVE